MAHLHWENGHTPQPRTFPVVFHGQKIGSGYYDKTGMMRIQLDNVHSELESFSHTEGSRVFNIIKKE